MFGLGKKTSSQMKNPAMVGQTTNAAPIQNGQPASAGGIPQAAPAHGKVAVKTAQKPDQSKAYTALKQGSVSIVDIISPASVEVDFKNIRVGDKFFRTFFVVDYPREVSPNWLSIL